MFGKPKKEIHKDDLSMVNFLMKMNTYGKFYMSNYNQVWSCHFTLNLTNGSKVEIRCDDKETPNDAVDGLVENMKAMDITLDGVTFEDFIK